MAHHTSSKKSSIPRPEPPPEALQEPADDSMLAEEISQKGPKSTTTAEITVPLPQQLRIMERHFAGESIRKISRAEDRARETVTKIVRSQEMRSYVAALRERLYGFGDYALAAVEHGLCEGKDARLGYRLLQDIGAVPSPHSELFAAMMDTTSRSERIRSWWDSAIRNCR